MFPYLMGDNHGAAVPEIHPLFSHLANNLNNYSTQKGQSLFFSKYAQNWLPDFYPRYIGCYCHPNKAEQVRQKLCAKSHNIFFYAFFSD